MFHVLAALHKHGCDMFMDLHGDEKLPYNFLSGSEGVPKWLLSSRLGDLQTSFVRALMEVWEGSCDCVGCSLMHMSV